MYQFPYFKDNNESRLSEFIEAYPFAFLTGSFLSGKQVATQIPILMEEREGQLFLKGHIMRNTDHHKAFIENPQALAVFSGPNCYVSASWYSDSQMGSTWNYMSAHFEGGVRFMEATELIDFMKKLTLKFEKGNTQSPTIYDNLPEAYLNQMLNGIVGIEIQVEHHDHVFKLSQNRDEQSYSNIISKLETIGGSSNMVAQEMRKRQFELFPKVVE